jgi:hypothetical protein
MVELTALQSIETVRRCPSSTNQMKFLHLIDRSAAGSKRTSTKSHNRLCVSARYQQSYKGRPGWNSLM